MKVENVEVYGLDASIRGMRNPKDSWELSDSYCIDLREIQNIDVLDIIANIDKYNKEFFILGNKDAKLSKQLVKAGPEHAKHLRMIQVWADIEVPRYLWQEIDTYNFVTKLSCSTMHKLFDKEITKDDFEMEYPISNFLNSSIQDLNELRAQNKLHNGQRKDVLIRAKAILPESYLQKRTINTNYAVIALMWSQRKHHLLPVWRKMLIEIIKQLPYFKEITGIDIALYL